MNNNRILPSHKKWKKFNFGSLFETIKKAESYSTEDLEIVSTVTSDSYLPYITRTYQDNGCKYFVTRDSELSVEAGNALIIGDTTASCFYQESEFVCGEHIVVLRNDQWLNRFTGLFIATLVNHERFRYSYGRALKIDIIKSMDISLPVDEEGNIAWMIIEEFIRSLHPENIATVNSLETPMRRVLIEDWKFFNVQRIAGRPGLLNLEICKCARAEDTEDGDDINYIGAKKNDNGYMRRVAYNRDLISKGNGIVFICNGQGSVGYTTYQPKEFIGTKDLVVGYDENLDPYVGLFLVSILDKERFKYSFGRKYKTHLSSVQIPLPAQKDSTGYVIDNNKNYSSEGFIPDWKFMRNFISQLTYGDLLNMKVY